jgi:hypothetical protein
MIRYRRAEADIEDSGLKEEAMRVSSSRAKVASNLSPSLTDRLNLYALAAGAAAAGLAGSGTAEAKVIYTPAHVTMVTGSTYDLDVNHDGHTDFQFSDSVYFEVGQLIVTPFASDQGMGGNAVVVARGFPFFPRALNRGARVGAGEYFYGSCVGCVTTNEIMAGFNEGGDYGNWVNKQNRFLGLRLVINNETHYGWARFSVQATDSSIVAVLTGYAYETSANTPIIAGETSGSGDDASETDGPAASALAPKLASQAVEPPSLGALALGAQGIPLWRSNPAEPASR